MLKLILLIEDDAFFAVMTAKMLAPATVRIARNGKEGMEYFDRERFDMVITDLVMPEKDGLSTIIDIRKQDTAVPIIAISGGGNIGTQGDLLRLAQTLGATATLAKPFGREQLLAKVRACAPSSEPCPA